MARVGCMTKIFQCFYIQSVAMNFVNDEFVPPFKICVFIYTRYLRIDALID